MQTIETRGIKIMNDFDFRTEAERNAPIPEEPTTSPLSIDDLLGTLYSFLLLIAISCLAFLFELCANFPTSKKNRELSMKSWAK